LARRGRRDGRSTTAPSAETIEEAEVFVSVVVPAYNEQDRMAGMLEEAVAFLQTEYGDAHGTPGKDKGANHERAKSNGSVKLAGKKPLSGWEILIVSDGSKDKTVQVALDFAKEHQLAQYPKPTPGPWKTPNPARVPHGSIRVVELEKNRGKGGAVVHGMRHVRGEYVLFADADGASNFEDLAGLILGCQSVADKHGRAVGIGSRAHMVGSEAVVKVSIHLLL
jgi:dolichyl-phosphate beta-glucosyltransferase